jgi:hypothetical protein
MSLLVEESGRGRHEPAALLSCVISGLLLAGCSASANVMPSSVSESSTTQHSRVQDIPGFGDPDIPECSPPSPWRCQSGGTITVTAPTVTIIARADYQVHVDDHRVFRSFPFSIGPNVSSTTGRFEGQRGWVQVDVSPSSASIQVAFDAPGEGDAFFWSRASGVPRIQTVPSTLSISQCSSQVDVLTELKVVLPHLGPVAVVDRHCRQ